MKNLNRNALFVSFFLLIHIQSFAQLFEEQASVLSTGYYPFGIWVDFDNDNDLDIVLTNSTGIFLYENVNGNFLEIANHGLPGIPAGKVSAGDYNGDGNIDLALEDPINKIYKNNGDKTFSEIPSIFDASEIYTKFFNPEWGDIDNDGDLDLLCTNYIFYNAGNDNFKQQRLNTISEPDDSKWIDYDNDGDLDQINLSGTGSHISFLLRNDRDSIFTKSGFNFYGHPSWGTNYGETGNGWDNCRVDVGDFNQNGLVDFIVAGRTRDNDVSNPQVTTAIYQNFGPDPVHTINGEEDWLFDQLEEGRTAATRSIKGAELGSIQWGDFNNDGLLDFINCGQGANGKELTFLYQNIDKDSFAIVANTLPNLARGFAAWGDYDNDGDLDLLIGGERTVNFNWVQEIGVYKNNIDQTSQNAPPSVPQKLKATVFEDSIVFSWDPSNDDKTGILGITYNMRIGSQPGLDDILPSNSDLETGKRKIVEMGNVGTGVFHYVQGLVKGQTYYASIQAVDASFQASQFSQELEFSNINKPIIVGTNFPPDLTFGVSNNTVGLLVNDRVGIKKYEFHYKGITSNNWNVRDTTFVLPKETVTIIDTVRKDMIDEQGLEYFYRILNADTIGISTDTLYSYIRFPDGNRKLTELIEGTNDSKTYQIISIPLLFDNNALRNALSGLGRIDSSLWRLFHYSDEKNVELNSENVNILPGLGYWLIIRDNSDFSFPESVNVPRNQKEPFVWKLRPGWNQIGNPYLFNISWQDVLNANPSIASDLSQFYYFDYGYKIQDIMPLWRGGFIRWEGTEEVEVRVYPKKVSQNGRKAGDEPDWDIPLQLENKRANNFLGQIGMDKSASNQLDHFDVIQPPGLKDFIYIDFDDLSTKEKIITGSIVASSPNYIWEFSIHSSNDQLSILTWQIPSNFPRKKKLLLVSVETKEIIDMVTAGHYSFQRKGESKYKIVFGDEEFINDQINIDKANIGNIYPNPILNVVNLPVYLPNEDRQYQVKIDLIDVNGTIITSGISRNLSPGFHVIQYETDLLLKKGIYFQNVRIKGSSFEKSFIQKVMKQ